MFVAAKIVFVLYNSDNQQTTFGDAIDIIVHGFLQDLATACYLAIVPWVASVVSIWVNRRWLIRATNIYYGLIALPLSLILVGDCILYSFWQFKLDATIFNYLDNLNNVTANISVLMLVLALVIIVAIAVGIWFGMHLITTRVITPCLCKIRTMVAFVLVAGLMFLAIRGGVGRSTMNPGHAYYSANQFCNHAAVNPAFSLFYSMLKYKSFNKLYQFYDNQAECERNFKQLAYSTQSIDTEAVLTTRRPNIVLILMEGLCANFIAPLGGEPDVTPNINYLSQEGLLFTRCYANSYRTDRGTVCALSGYPSFPDFSVMKITEKSSKLPSIARSLADNGYTTSYLYGGDKNFTNANSYLLATGYQKVWGCEHFPSSVRKTHSWGVTDYIVLDTLYNNIRQQYATGKPFFITCQTLASHEDWIVPYNRIRNNPKANSMAYLDDCIGKLVKRLRHTPMWDNLLLVLIPDHGIAYPDSVTEEDIQKYHIPILWIGGAVKRQADYNKLCNQTDLAATLLGQLGISHHEFTFSRDVFSSTYTNPCAIHTFNSGVSLIDTTGVTIEDLTSRQILEDYPTPGKERTRRAHSFLQTAIRDLYKR